MKTVTFISDFWCFTSFTVISWPISFLQRLLLACYNWNLNFSRPLCLSLLFEVFASFTECPQKSKSKNQKWCTLTYIEGYNYRPHPKEGGGFNVFSQSAAAVGGGTPSPSHNNSKHWSHVLSREEYYSLLLLEDTPSQVVEYPVPDVGYPNPRWEYHKSRGTSWPGNDWVPPARPGLGYPSGKNWVPPWPGLGVPSPLAVSHRRTDLFIRTDWRENGWKWYCFAMWLLRVTGLSRNMNSLLPD